jgi:hypothetical protein
MSREFVSNDADTVDQVKIRHSREKENPEKPGAWVQAIKGTAD